MPDLTEGNLLAEIDVACQLPTSRLSKMLQQLDLLGYCFIKEL